MNERKLCRGEAERRAEKAGNGFLGYCEGNDDVNMPPFGVEMVGGQGNGDCTDSVIALEGAISNDAGENMLIELLPGGNARGRVPRCVERYGRPFPITAGEAGLYRDSEGWYFHA